MVLALEKQLFVKCPQLFQMTYISIYKRQFLKPFHIIGFDDSLFKCSSDSDGMQVNAYQRKFIDNNIRIVK